LNAIDLLKYNDLAFYDPLTGVRNVRGFDEHLDEQVALADTRGAELSILFIDIDRLKLHNDRLGHRIGSQAISATAECLRSTLDPRGVIFRFGGDEFVVVCPDIASGEAVELAERLRRDVEQNARSKAPELAGARTLSVSIGVASLRSSLTPGIEGTTERTARLLTAADRALYRAKGMGRNRVCLAASRDDTLSIATEPPPDR
jgi:diguanylate cyclase (GGDEF)-like protein